MQFKRARTQHFIARIRCDRCERLFEHDDLEFQGIVSVDLKAGYGSVFGDGNDAQVDLCSSCLKLTLGRWLRIVAPVQRTKSIERLVNSFGHDQQGGEPPRTADETFFMPEVGPAHTSQPNDGELPAPEAQEATSATTEPPMKNWNFRVIEFASEEDTWYAIHEVYYEHGKPFAYSDAPAALGWMKGGGPEAGRARLEKIGEALCMPSLKESDLEEAS